MLASCQIGCSYLSSVSNQERHLVSSLLGSRTCNETQLRKKCIVIVIVFVVFIVIVKYCSADAEQSMQRNSTQTGKKCKSYGQKWFGKLKCKLCSASQCYCQLEQRQPQIEDETSNGALISPLSHPPRITTIVALV